MSLLGENNLYRLLTLTCPFHWWPPEKLDPIQRPPFLFAQLAFYTDHKYKFAGPGLLSEIQFTIYTEIAVKIC